MTYNEIKKRSSNRDGKTTGCVKSEMLEFHISNAKHLGTIRQSSHILGYSYLGWIFRALETLRDINIKVLYKVGCQHGY